MTGEKILEVVAMYRKFLGTFFIPQKEFPKGNFMPGIGGPKTREIALSHCNWMLDRIEEFVHDGKIEKAFRWLGFIQGVFWYSGMFTVEELANHNRPKEG